MSFFSEGITKNKLIILSTLSELSASPTREQMTTFFGEYDILPYFELQTAVSELEEGGFIAAVPRPYGQAYCLTEAGRKTYEMFSERLPESERARISKSAAAFGERLRRETQYSCTFERQPNGSYEVMMRAMDFSGELMKIELLAPDETSAKRISAEWPNEAEAIYATLIERLMR